MMFTRTLVPSALSLALAAAATAQPAFTVIDLGTLPGRENCDCFSPAAIGESNVVVGTYFGAAGDHRGFAWASGRMQDLGVAAASGGGQARFTPRGVNSAGRAVGFGPARACYSDFGAVTDLPTLGGPFGVASDISNSGVIVGQASLANGASHAAMWTAGPAGDATIVTDLGALFGGTGGLSEAFAVNSSRQVVGASLDAAFQHQAFVWTSQTGMTALAALPGTVRSSARGINSGGMIIGTADIAQPAGGGGPTVRQRGVVWTGGVPTDLGDLGDPPDLPIIPSGINDFGVVVGASLREGSDIVRSFYWESGVMTDLNTLLAPGTPWTVQVVTDINNQGRIVGLATGADGRTHAVMLVPVAGGGPCPADFDGSGELGAQDLFSFLAAWFASLPGADFNASAAVTVQDIFDFLASYFRGCP
ncbi:MAG: hypothetical protein IT438_00465 [Phycisphaerales bacterium]|nr:hypothetical protein [Phycisphaerales bacterium]